MKDVIIMAAPNGARASKADHPALPITIEEITQEALRCRDAGASVIHAHVRDKDGAHVLDSGLYTELLAEIDELAPGLLVQITTEAVGRYSPYQQKEIVHSVKPDMASVALREMVPSPAEESSAGEFYTWAAEADIHIQHILYDAADVQYYKFLRSEGIIPEHGPSGVLFVLGRYASNLIADSAELLPMVREAGEMSSPWFCCAFGKTEAACMKLAMEQGGHPRVGFENNRVLNDGVEAKGSYELVAQTVETAKALGLNVLDAGRAKELLWRGG